MQTNTSLAPQTTANVVMPASTNLAQVPQTSIDLARLNQKIIQLVVSNSDSDLFSKVFDYAVNGAKTNEAIAAELGLTAEEDALARSLSFGNEGFAGVGPITNSQTGEVYVSQDALNKALWGNCFKLSVNKILGTLVQVAKVIFSGDKAPAFGQIASSILNDNQDFFTAVLNDALGPHLNSNTTFSSLVRKAVTAIERGIDRVLAESPTTMPASNTLVTKAAIPVAAAV